MAPSYTLEHRAPIHGGIRSDVGWYFERGSDALKCAADIGAPPIDVPSIYLDRPAKLEETRKGWLVYSCDIVDSVVFPRAEKTKTRWRRNLGIKADCRPIAEQTAEVDEFLRAVSVEAKLTGVVQPGFYFRTRDKWLHYDRHKVECGLMRMGVAAPKDAMGTACLYPWTMVRVPFAPEYLDGRRWNLGAAQLRHPQPARGEHPDWDRILGHIGKDLDKHLAKLDWAKAAGIKTGAQYLLTLIAFLVRHPELRWPYMFLWSEGQNCGKSILHEAIDECLITSGVVRADAALTSQSDFNGELSGAVLAVVEEKDISKAGAAAYNKIKDWVTSLNVSIHAKGQTPHAQVNYLHFLQCANSHDACPISLGDTRITMIRVSELTHEIPKGALLARLNQQASALTHTLLNLTLPAPVGRLCLPHVDTDSKVAAIDANVDDFIAAVVAHYQDVGPFDFVAKELPTMLGVGKWPKSMKAIRRKLDDYGRYLLGQGITASIRPAGKETYRAYIA